MGDVPPPYSADSPPQPPPYSPEPPTQGHPPPPPVGFQGSAPQAGAPVPVVVSPQPATAQVVVLHADFTCPVCKSGFVRDEFTCCGICLGIFFFPLGMLCCFLMRVRRCSNCRALLT